MIYFEKRLWNILYQNSWNTSIETHTQYLKSNQDMYTSLNCINNCLTEHRLSIKNLD